MKFLRFIAPFLLAAVAFAQQPKTVQKASDGTNAITESLVIGNGKTLSATGTGTITATSVPASGITGSITAASVPASGITGTLSNAQLANSSVTIGSTAVSLGGTAATIAGLTLTTPNLGTPSAAILTNATGLPLSTGVTGTLAVANGGTGTTTSTGTGNIVLSNSPTLTTPNIGAATGTSVNLTGNVIAGGNVSATGGDLTLNDTPISRVTLGNIRINPATGTASSLRLALNGVDTSQVAISGGNTFIDYAGTISFRSGFGGTNRATIDASGNTATSGNLTVSGGAAAITSSSGLDASLSLTQTGWRQWRWRVPASTTSLALRDNDGVLDVLTFAAGTGNATFAGSISASSASLTTALPIASGGTGAADASTARTNLGLGSIATQASTNVSITGGSISTTKVKSLIESGTASATAATGSLNFDVKTQTVLFYTSNASGNWTLNLRGDSGTTLDSLMAVGDSLTLTFLVTQGATAYYPTALTIDGNSVTPKWAGGSAPTSGNASGIDSYTYTAIKTASATFTVLAGQTQYK